MEHIEHTSSFFPFQFFFEGHEFGKNEMIIPCITFDLPFPILHTHIPVIKFRTKIETSWAETLPGETCHLVAVLSSTWTRAWIKGKTVQVFERRCLGEWNGWTGIPPNGHPEAGIACHHWNMAKVTFPWWRVPQDLICLWGGNKFTYEKPYSFHL